MDNKLLLLFPAIRQHKNTTVFKLTSFSSSKITQDHYISGLHDATMKRAKIITDNFLLKQADKTITRLHATKNLPFFSNTAQDQFRCVYMRQKKPGGRET